MGVILYVGTKLNWSKKCHFGFPLLGIFSIRTCQFVQYLLSCVDELRSIISVASEPPGNSSQQLYPLATVLGNLESIQVETNYNSIAH